MICQICRSGAIYCGMCDLPEYERFRLTTAKKGEFVEVTAKIEKPGTGAPTVIVVNGLRYVLDMRGGKVGS